VKCNSLIFLLERHTFLHTTLFPYGRQLLRFGHRKGLLCLALLVWAPVAVFPSDPIIIRPQFDESIGVQRSFYPYKILKRPRIALVLSGGGARGVAQIGVLKALEKHNIPVDLIAATSLGAIVGGLYASGYTTAELESLALNTNWEEVLSLRDDTKRTDLFIDQKLADDRSFLAVRFEGLEPVIPSAVSTGQRLTNFLNTQTLQALYHPDPSFDDLKIRFRAVTTDLVSGKRIILNQGSLAEALRASATVPLLFSPIEKDSMQLIDGGLVTNIPVDVALDEGYDIVVAVNSTSGLRNADELNAPWQTADQIMGIMMQVSNELQLKNASVVITPDIGKHLSSDFTRLDFLIKKGEEAAEEKIGEIQLLFQEEMEEAGGDTGNVFDNVVVDSEGKEMIPDSIWKSIQFDATTGQMSTQQIRRHLRTLYATGNFKDVLAEVHRSSGTNVVYRAVPNPLLNSVEFSGCSLVDSSVLRASFAPLLSRVVNHATGIRALEDLLRTYRNEGYSLARIKAASFDEETGVLRVAINEGVVTRIEVEGTVRSQDYFVLREFPIENGDVFEITKAQQGITNINSTNLYEYVHLEVTYRMQQPILTIKLKERPTQLVRLGLRVDNERNVQGSIDIRDESFLGTGSELGLTFAGGGRNRELNLEYKAHRLFNTYLTFNISGFYTFTDSYVYVDAPRTRENHWERQRVGEYRDVRYGGRLIFGSQLERLGNATVEFSVQNTRIKSLENVSSLGERYRLALVRIGTIIDSKNSYPFPTAGVGLNLSYESAFEEIGSEVGYNALRVMYESYSSWGERLTFHPKVTVGFADRTMPFGQQFRLGGRESFFGLREDDRRGRQMMLFNIEGSYHLPMRILFETYWRLRYDLASISSAPEELKLKTFRHGIGTELAFDTPIGPAMFGVGQSFFFGRELPNNPLQLGALLFYFMIGYQL